MNLKEQIARWKEFKRETYNCISLNHFIANSLNIEFSLSKVFYPILFRDKLVQFTNTVFISNGSGNEYYLVLVDGKYLFFEYGYEADCDGAYHYGYLKSFTEVLSYIDEFKIGKEVYTSTLLENLKNL